MDYDYGHYDTDISLDQDPYYYGGGEPSPMTLEQVFSLCLKPALSQAVKSIIHVFIWCFVYRLSLLFVKSFSFTHHIISFLTGMLSLHMLFSLSVYYIVFFALLTYVLLFILSYFQFNKCRGIFLILTSLCFLCVCELWLVEPKNWLRIRGPQMIAVMKSVSLAFDLDIGTVKSIPNLIAYAGYMLCPNSCVFGPWLSFNDYKLIGKDGWSFRSIKNIFVKFFLAIFFLSISTCWCEYFIPTGSSQWFSAYRDALSFRTSHYFISYLSESTVLLSGFSSTGFNGVSKPLLVEFPRSIVNVVVYWNIPMHNWLKIYVFNTSRKFGNFFAILSTYTVSSLLHGINFQLSAVLFSLGVYSYVELMLRKRLAAAFNACILAKSCKPECSHKFKKYHPFVILTNGFWILLTIFHLAYLGVAIDSSGGRDWTHTLDKWSSLNYMSHYVAFFTYVMYFCVR